MPYTMRLADDPRGRGPDGGRPGATGIGPGLSLGVAALTLAVQNGALLAFGVPTSRSSASSERDGAWWRRSSRPSSCLPGSVRRSSAPRWTDGGQLYTWNNNAFASADGAARRSREGHFAEDRSASIASWNLANGCAPWMTLSAVIFPAFGSVSPRRNVGVALTPAPRPSARA